MTRAIALLGAASLLALTACGDKDTGDTEEETPSDPGPAGNYQGAIEGSSHTTISDVPWQALCAGNAQVTVDQESLVSGTFLCEADDPADTHEGYFSPTTIPGQSDAQLQVGTATVQLRWVSQDDQPAVKLEIDGSKPGPTGSDLSATIEINGSLVFQSP